MQMFPNGLVNFSNMESMGLGASTQKPSICIKHLKDCLLKMSNPRLKHNQFVIYCQTT